MHSNMFLYFASTQSSLICASLQPKKETLLSSYWFLLFAQLFPRVASLSLAICLSHVVIYHVPPQYITSAPKPLKQGKWCFSHQSISAFWCLKRIWKHRVLIENSEKNLSVNFSSFPEQSPKSQKMMCEEHNLFEAYHFKIFFPCDSYIVQVISLWWELKIENFTCLKAVASGIMVCSWGRGFCLVCW